MQCLSNQYECSQVGKRKKEGNYLQYLNRVYLHPCLNPCYCRP